MYKRCLICAISVGHVNMEPIGDTLPRTTRTDCPQHLTASYPFVSCIKYIVNYKTSSGFNLQEKASHWRQNSNCLKCVCSTVNEKKKPSRSYAKLNKCFQQNVEEFLVE